MLRSVTSLLAVEVGQYCIVDVVDQSGRLRRLEIEHADPSRRARLRVACEDATFESGSRVPRLIAAGTAELVSRVSQAARARNLGDVNLLDGEHVRSYMAAPVVVNGATMALFTLVVTSGTRRYDDGDLRFLSAVAGWTGLGLENALRRERDAQSRPREDVGHQSRPHEDVGPRRRVSTTLPRQRVSSPPAHPMGEEAPTAVRRMNPLRRSGQG